MMKKPLWLLAVPLLMIAVVSYAQRPPTHAAVGSAPAAPKWEYSKIQYGTVLPTWEALSKMTKEQGAEFVKSEKEAEEGFMKKLNTAGTEGWELVSLDRATYPMPGMESRSVTAYLKRPR